MVRKVLIQEDESVPQGDLQEKNSCPTNTCPPCVTERVSVPLPLVFIEVDENNQGSCLPALEK